ncbi:hypothetical protein GDO81_027093 [Engystomops pustulosus]|uniref:Uncharacterized protein n=1 Tax=Engystomops pustulosus TaxID=76066 RepID=A0AAV6YMV2_ENGPU|nr:hypothetical protein GDO81_027093 [Engystomops pustulosus]
MSYSPITPKAAYTVLLPAPRGSTGPRSPRMSPPALHTSQRGPSSQWLHPVPKSISIGTGLTGRERRDCDCSSGCDWRIWMMMM